MDKISLLLVNRYQIVLDAWRISLDDDDRFQVICATRQTSEVLDFVSHTWPHVILCDSNVEEMTDFNLTRALKRTSPRSKVIGVSVHSFPTYAKRWLAAGVSGYLNRYSSLEELKSAIVTVNKGRKFICAGVKEVLADSKLIGDTDPSMAELTGKEWQIVQALKAGMTSKDIGKMIGITNKAVDAHRYNILKKLNLHSTVALINFINQRGC